MVGAHVARSDCYHGKRDVTNSIGELQCLRMAIARDPVEQGWATSGRLLLPGGLADWTRFRWIYHQCDVIGILERCDVLFFEMKTFEFVLLIRLLISNG